MTPRFRGFQDVGKVFLDSVTRAVLPGPEVRYRFQDSQELEKGMGSEGWERLRKGKGSLRVPAVLRLLGEWSF